MAEADEESTASEKSAAAIDAFADATGAASGGGGAAKASGTTALFRRALGGLARWHPFVFLGASLALAAYAWMVYPRSETRRVPSAEELYFDGADRLFRALNPDLPLLAPTLEDEALAARNSLLNLFVFHRADLDDYPRFINPHLLLGEANRLLAEINPRLAAKYYQDAASAFADAEIWEARLDDPERHAIHILYNFLGGPPTDGRPPADVVEERGGEIALRRERRLEYIRFRRAEADAALGRPESARAILEDLQRRLEVGRREEMLGMIADDTPGSDVPRRPFELGPDEFRSLDFLLARVYEGLGLPDRARGRYLSYLSAVPDSRRRAFVIERLAVISMEKGEAYRRANPETAAEAFAAAVEFYRELAASPASSADRGEAAFLGLAVANSRLAELTAAGDPTGIDELTAAGRRVRGWLEALSGRTLPHRTLALPLAMGKMLSTPEFIFPEPRALPVAVGGTLATMAGGLVVTPHEQIRTHRILARDNFDRVAGMARGGEEGDRAMVMAARESWLLGDKADAEARFFRMLDPLSDPDVILAARAGLAEAALDRGDLDRAQRIILGGYAHPGPLWFVQNDADWRKLIVQLGDSDSRASHAPLLRIWETIPPEGAQIAAYAASGRRLDDEFVTRFIRALNTTLRRPDFYREDRFPPLNRNFHLARLLSMDPELLTADEVVWRNRLLMEEAWPYDLARRGARDIVGFDPFPAARELTPGGLVEPERVRDLLLRLGDAWEKAADDDENLVERARKLIASNLARRMALDSYQGDPGEIHFALAGNFEALAEIREAQGRHLDALSSTAEAARNFLDVSLRARGSPREMDALLAAGDAFFRAGLLARTIEAMSRFLERFGYSATSGTEGTMAVVRAENLLGRAHWFLNDVPRALESFRRNIPRRTPDRYKSIYYMGRVMMDEGAFRNDAELLGDHSDPLPRLDRNGDPIIGTALHAFNWLRQSPGINPEARAWRWSTFDLGKLNHLLADRARRRAEEAGGAQPQTGEETADGGSARSWLALYDRARANLTEALDRYPLRRNGGYGLSVRVEPEDFADVMTARFEAEFLLADTLLVLAEGRGDETLAALARAHLANLGDRARYANALFDPDLDRFQLNSAIILEETESGVRNRQEPLPRTRLGDDEGPTRSPRRLRGMLFNGMQRLAGEYMRAGDLASARPDGAVEAVGHYRAAYEVFQDIYDRFGADHGALAMVGMGDALARLGRRDDAATHYRAAWNMAQAASAGERAEGALDMGPSFWGARARERLADGESGFEPWRQ